MLMICRVSGTGLRGGLSKFIADRSVVWRDLGEPRESDALEGATCAKTGGDTTNENKEAFAAGRGFFSEN